MHIALIGCGNMGGALASRWLADGLAGRIDILDPSPPRHALLKNAENIRHMPNPETFETQADVVILAVKPQIMKEACTKIKDKLPENALLVSIAAGLPLAFFEEIFSSRRPIVRVMPNTPAACGAGMSVAIANASVTPTQKKSVDVLLCAAGKSAWIEDEEQMHAVTALSGSGPAYIFLLIAYLARAGEKAGLPEDIAAALARQTVYGAGVLAENSDDVPAITLKENVTSPGGTTAAALSILEDGRLEEIIKDAVRSAARRSKELSGG